MLGLGDTRAPGIMVMAVVGRTRAEAPKVDCIPDRQLPGRDDDFIERLSFVASSRILPRAVPPPPPPTLTCDASSSNLPPFENTRIAPFSSRPSSISVWCAEMAAFPRGIKTPRDDAGRDKVRDCALLPVPIDTSVFRRYSPFVRCGGTNLFADVALLNVLSFASNIASWAVDL